MCHFCVVGNLRKKVCSRKSEITTLASDQNDFSIDFKNQMLIQRKSEKTNNNVNSPEEDYLLLTDP